MAVTDWKNPGTAANLDRDSKSDWSNVDNAKDGSDATYATNAVVNGTYSDWLHLSNYGFSTSDIPAGSTIDGIEVQIRKRAGKGGYLKDSSFFLCTTGGQVGSDYADTATAWSTTIFTSVYGGSTDKWGYAWDEDDIVGNSDFGLQFSGKNDYSTTQNEYIYWAQIRVYYTEAAASYTVFELDNAATVMEMPGFRKFMGVVYGVPSGVVPEVYMVNSTATCDEGDGSKTIEVRLSQATTNEVTVHVQAAGVNAYNYAQQSTYGHGADYALDSDILTFPASSVSQNISLTIIQGTAALPNVQFTLTLTDVGGATLREGSTTCTVTITKNVRDAQVTMTNLPSTCPIGGCSGWGGSTWNLYNNETNGAANRSRMQALMDHWRTQHSGKAIVHYFPLGTYQIYCDKAVTDGVYLPTLTNKITLIGASADPREDTGSHSVLKAQTPYANWTRMLRNDNSAYMYAHATTNSGKNRLLLRNLIFDMDSQNCGQPYEDYEMEQVNAVFITALHISGSTWQNGLLEFTAERCRDKWNPNGGLRAFYNTSLSMYQYRSSNSYKGFCVMSGGHQWLDAHDILSDGDVDGGGFWMEAYMDRYDLHVTGSNWTINNGRRFYCSPGTDTIYPGNPGSFDVSGIYFGKHTSPVNDPYHVPALSYANWGVGASDPTITISDSVIYSPTIHRCRANGKIRFNNVRFISYKHSTVTSGDLTSALYNQYGANYEPSSFNEMDWQFTNCTFENDGSIPAGGKPIGHLYNAGLNWSACGRMQFFNCTFEGSVYGASKCRYAAYGGPRLEYYDCTFKCSNAGSQYCFDLNEWRDTTNYQGLLIVKNPTYQLIGNKIYDIYSASSGTQYYCWIIHSGTLTRTQAENSITQTNAFTGICFANADCSAEISALTAGSTTTVTTVTAHGLKVDDEVMFDGFHATTNADWYTDLSPASAVPKFTVTSVTNAYTFVCDANTTGNSAYSATADIARVSRYPLRTVVGNAGDDPTVEQPAGCVGDRYIAGANYYMCTTSGVRYAAVWTAE